MSEYVERVRRLCASCQSDSRKRRGRGAAHLPELHHVRVLELLVVDYLSLHVLGYLLRDARACVKHCLSYPGLVPDFQLVRLFFTT